MDTAFQANALIIILKVHRVRSKQVLQAMILVRMTPGCILSSGMLVPRGFLRLMYHCMSE